MASERDHFRKADRASVPRGRTPNDAPEKAEGNPGIVSGTDPKTEPSEVPLSPGFSRRELLRRAGIAGAVSALPAGAMGALPLSLILPAGASEPAQEPFETLTAAESDTLEAIVARLIPTDENGPGATEARAAHYIDRALTGPLAASRSAYASGIEALNRYTETSRGAPFVQLGSGDQDAVLREMESDVATGFVPDASTFFDLLRTHTIEGTFCDPYYGGNADFTGWDLIGYPGVRIAVTPQEQSMDEVPAPNHRSAYDYSMFTKGGA